jgi:phosphoribosylamine--glycine ligase
VKVLVLGSGAREHALARLLTADDGVTAVIAAPGNAGIDTIALCEPFPEGSGVTDRAAVVELARRHDVDLVVVGPEAPLVAGVSDALRAAGYAVFGPSAEAARLEGSKAFAKEVMAAAGVPTALAHVCTTLQEVETALDALGAPHVVKDDGLAAGKGVVVTDGRAVALEHARSCLDKGPGSEVVIEEFLAGPEVSVFCLTDGVTVVALPPAQDFKRLLDGDAGPNTGGMGAYSPLEWAPPTLVHHVLERIAQPTIDEMRRRGTPFVGVLYVGLALTSRGPRVIEFNCRFGDPDGQVSLGRLVTPLGGLLMAAATGTLDGYGRLEVSSDHVVTVVVAAQGYPSAPRTGDPITGLEEAEEVDGAHVLHAGTRRDADGILLSAGGRVVGVVATGGTLAQARATAYRAVDLIGLEGSQHRTDIALAAERGEIHIPGTADGRHD